MEILDIYLSLFPYIEGGARIVERKDLKRHLTPDNRKNGPSEE